MSKRPVHYWDSACCISFLRGDADRLEQCQSTLQAAEEGNIEIVISSLTIAEVLHVRGHDPQLPPGMRKEVRRFFQQSMFLIVNVDRRIAEHAQDIFYDHGVKPKDAIHVAAALFAVADRLDTFDVGLQKRSGLIGSPALIIGAPEYRKPKPTTKDTAMGQSALFDLQ